MKAIRIGLAILILMAGLLILFINRNIAGLADWILPGSALWVHLLLLAVEGISLLWLWRGMFGRHEHLLLMGRDSAADRERFQAEFARRMERNPHIIKADLDPADPDHLEKCLEVLKREADLEIRQNARRIFLATALTQNGRLDALIVFVSLCRLVWRVSSIYNQKPHPREISSLYWAVASTTFLALTLEELDVTTEIAVGFGEAFQAMAPAGVTASIPFAGKALQTFTSSAIDGTANCYLALRAGIITRNAFSYRAMGEPVPGRAAVFREAGGVLLELSRDLMDRLAASLAGGVAGMARAVQSRTVQAGGQIVDSFERAGQTIGASAGKAASGTLQAAQAAGSGIVRAGTETGSGLVRIVRKTGQFLGSATLGTAKGTAYIARAPFRLTRGLLNRSRSEPESEDSSSSQDR